MPLMQKVAVHPMSIMKDKKDSKDGAKGKDGAKVSQNNLVFLILFIFIDLCWIEIWMWNKQICFIFK